MKEALLKNSRWMEGGGPETEIVISSRVRLARNLKGEPFPCLAHAAVNETVLQKLLCLAAEDEALKSLTALIMADLSVLEKQALMEKQLISPTMVRECEQGAALVSCDEALCIMINEEDHLRIQAIFPGLQLEEAYSEAARVDDIIEAKLAYAYSERYGYLTACPTNIGTGLRASVMLHLPGLIKTRRLERLQGALSQVGLTVRGPFGEGSEVAGRLVQVSNQVTLGLSEEDIIANLHSLTAQVIEQEQTARQSLLDQDRAAVADKAWRALGLLKYSQLMEAKEAMELISDLRLGCDLGLVKGVDCRILNELLVVIRPGMLQLLAGKDLDEGERKLERPLRIREIIKRLDQD